MAGTETAGHDTTEVVHLGSAEPSGVLVIVVLLMNGVGLIPALLTPAQLIQVRHILVQHILVRIYKSLSKPTQFPGLILWILKDILETH